MVVLGFSRELIMTILALQFLVSDTRGSCEMDSECKKHQVCCDDRCSSWPKCFLNSDKECYYDTHCAKGTICVQNICKSTERTTASCRTDRDCVYKKRHSNSHEKLVRRKCCSQKCVKGILCPSNFSTTILPTIRANTTIAGTSIGHNKCKNNSCVALEMTGASALERPSSTLSKAGFLSAAILTAAVFLIVMCCCFLRETTYFKFCGLGTRRGATSTPYHSPCSAAATAPFCTDSRSTEQQREQQTARTENYRPAASWTLFPGLYGFNETGNCYNTSRETTERGAVPNLSRGPPSYHSVYLDHELPPSYDEAVNYCPNHFYSANTDSRTERSCSSSERCS